MEKLVTLVDTLDGTVLVTLDKQRVRSDEDTGVVCKAIDRAEHKKHGPALSTKTYREVAVDYLVFGDTEQGAAPQYFSHTQASLIITAVIRTIESFASKHANQHVTG